MPTRRFDPRYVKIGGKTQDNRLLSFPTRSSSRNRGSSLKRSISSSRTTSLSPTRPPDIIDPAATSQALDHFTRSVIELSSQRGCVITGKGDLRGHAGPGLEAAHIVPQSQWNTFPINEKNGIANPEVDSELEIAWKGTWR